MSDHAYMRILPHNADLSANLVQPVFLLLPPALLALSPLRFVKFLAGVYRAGDILRVNEDTDLSHKLRVQGWKKKLKNVLFRGQELA